MRGSPGQGSQGRPCTRQRRRPFKPDHCPVGHGGHPMTDLSNVKIPSLRSKVADSEWQARVDLAACYRLIAHFGMNDLIYNHATARVPDEEGHFLINAYG